ncbi:dicarboxylate/amino acid:cation symporter [Thermoflavimicrobium dichotomicum]|uniref:Na+/H+-dicarboxylate symporter n=1 Tax=Thermoflavimicrobium dichotomicum TaxID=46223 RepID=A0A1I3UWW4_9BACL|nr:dicarboxylate/amino acid:cation symporter [Thermoflavimicrobium dichotomicum]SFJ87372.1 Na+/H+-dicarboxylate symporter [Thermoflavimicrobium dichotomicum]
MRAYRFTIILLSSIIIGGLLGVFMGKEATVLKPLGDLFLNFIFTIVIPLVFFTISSSIAKMDGVKRFGKIMGSMMGIFLFTGLIAAIISLFVMIAIPPAQGVEIPLEKPEQVEKVGLAEQVVKTFTVSEFGQLFSRDNMLALILFSIFVGVATSMIGEKGKPFSSFLQSGAEVFMKIINLAMLYAPIGLGAYFATLVGEFGPTLLGTYFRAAAIYYPLSLLYFFVAFTLYAYIAGRKQGVIQHWKNMLSPAATALATCSSAATIPVNLEAARNMGVSKDICETVIPMGAVLHKDGSVIGGVLKIVFLFGIFHKDIHDPMVWLSIIAVSLLVGIVMGAIPSGGLIGETLIISLYDFPVEALPIIAAISTIIDPPATMLNASGDNVASMMVARFIEGKNWIKKAVTMKEF